MPAALRHYGIRRTSITAFAVLPLSVGCGREESEVLCWSDVCRWLGEGSASMGSNQSLPILVHNMLVLLLAEWVLGRSIHEVHTWYLIGSYYYTVPMPLNLTNVRCSKIRSAVRSTSTGLNRQTFGHGINVVR